MVKNRKVGGEVGIMKIKKIYIFLIIISILILIFAFNQKSKGHREDSNKNILEENLNKETEEVILETTKEPPQREENKEERVKKMYELMPPGETIVE